MMIRQWENGIIPGSHATYFTNYGNPLAGNIGVTDVYNHFYYTQIHDNGFVHDMAIYGNIVYFSGVTYTGKVMLGWVSLIDIISLTTSSSLNIDTMTFATVTPTLQSLDNIDVYQNTSGRICIVGYGRTPTGYMGVEYIVGSALPDVTFGVLPYTPYDLTLTDNLVVFAGTTGNDLILHPFNKDMTFDMPNVPYYSYAVSSATEIEPYRDLRVTDIGYDHVAVLNYRNGGGMYYMMLREFDVSGVFSIYSLPMLTTFQTPFNYSIPYGGVLDFFYDATKKVYLVFQNYEVTPSHFHDVVTKINFSAGTPSFVQSDYLTMSGLPMKSMSLSDSSMYVVYGYDATSYENAFWKDISSAMMSSRCITTDPLPMIEFPLDSDVRNDCYYGTPFFSGAPVSTSFIDNKYESISTICH